MAEFLKGSEINSHLEKIFRKADYKLTLISPYIKLHEKLKDLLLTHKENHKLLITVVFGKNEDCKSKSLPKTDFEFITQFRNVQILYHPRLHAKFYQNDWNSLLTSMNLYNYSQDNNIEFGILTTASEGKAFKEKLDKEASLYFDEIMQTSKVLFDKTPQYEKSLGGFKSTYTHSIVEVDKLSEIYESKAKTFAPKFHEEVLQPKIKFTSITQLSKSLGVNKKELDSLFEQKAWIAKEGKVWKLTDEGSKIGGVIKKWQKGEYIAFPESIKEKIKI